MTLRLLPVALTALALRADVALGACTDYPGSDAAVCADGVTATPADPDSCCRDNAGTCTEVNDCCPLTTVLATCEGSGPGTNSAFDFCTLVTGTCTAVMAPTSSPTTSPTTSPTSQPSSQPSEQPSSMPSEAPSAQPSAQPSRQPSSMPSEHPSSQPSSAPSAQPSAQPSEAPSANPSQGCENVRTDCGWGIFNPWTCRCDCPVGICLDNNEQCYHPCAETIHTNPWAGCSPGWDCPWYPDADVGHCVSKLHQPNHFEIYRTAKECCDEHYAGSDTCLDTSKAPWIYHYDRDTPFPNPGDELPFQNNGHAPYPWPIHFPGLGEHRPDKPYVSEGTTSHGTGWGQELGNGPAWYPDLVNKLNCVYGDNYEDWMNDEGFAAEYLFPTSNYVDDGGNERDGGKEDCCEKWYPHLGANCPDADPFNPVNAEAEDEPWNSDPYSAHNYYFPDFSDNSCHFGRDYPAWMGWNRYEKYYLFREEDADLCCERFFPGQSCPNESHLDADKPQQDYYWTSYQENLSNFDEMPLKYNHTYWPDINGKTCVNGTDYPDWMGSDTDYVRLYLFKSLDGCCNEWFTDQNINDCRANVRQGFYHYDPCAPNRRNPEDCDTTINYSSEEAHIRGKWYPDLDAYECKQDGAMPDWMLEEDYVEWYLFNTEAQCCAAFGYCDRPGWDGN